MWRWAAAAGLAAVLTGFVSPASALDVLERVAPVLIFLVGITVVAEISDAAGVFSAAARLAARLGRGRTLALWLLVVALATAATTVLSLDTTAVLLTPVVLALARQLGLPPAVFAMTTVWLANTASLLLPVSNLTNLLALHALARTGTDLGGYLRLTWPPALVSVLVTAVVLAVFHGRDLRGRYTVPVAPQVSDTPLFWACAAVCCALGPAFVTGIQVAWPASIAAAVLIVVAARRRPAVLRASVLPWRVVVLVLGLFLVVQGFTDHGLPALGEAVAGDGTSWPELLRLAATGALGANALDNLPAYLALEPVAGDSPVRLVALLIGVDLGPLVTLWASLATLLWRERCRAAGVDVPIASFALQGLVLVPLLLLTSTAALALGAR